MKIQIQREHLQTLSLGMADRSPTSRERNEIRRIINVWSAAGSDPNVSEITLKNFISERDVILLLSSCCPEIIELTFQILTLQRDFSVNPESETSLLLGVIWFYPNAFRVLISERGWRYRDDVSETLQKIRIRKHYKRHPKKQQRIRGYRDKGNLPDSQRVLRQKCLSDYYAEEVYRALRYEKELRDTLELIFGMIM